MQLTLGKMNRKYKYRSKESQGTVIIRKVAIIRQFIAINHRTRGEVEALLLPNTPVSQRQDAGGTSSSSFPPYTSSWDRFILLNRTCVFVNK